VSQFVAVSHSDPQPLTAHPSGTCALDGGGRGAPVEGLGLSLWAYRLQLGAAAVMNWTTEHEDEVVFVHRGRLRDRDGAWTCSAGDALVIEAGVPATLVVDENADVVHFGSRPGGDWGLLGPPEGERTVYVRRGEDRASHESQVGHVAVTTSFWADSTRPSSRLALLEVTGSSGHASPPHAHSSDEIIYVLEGEVTIGRNVLGPHASVFIPADRRYRFTTPGQYRFINFRRDASTIVVERGSEPILETAAVLSGHVAY
jgi:quercetin dioxygenase-like cupin family protein